MQERFWIKVDKSQGPDACWPWVSTIGSRGYGEFRINNRKCVASRVSYELTHGPIPAGLCVCHSCDNMICVNPAHLWLGTHADNMRDMFRKGRAKLLQRYGELSSGAKLTDDKVKQIRSLGPGLTHRQIGNRFGVSRQAISDVLAGKSWPTTQPLKR